MRPTFESPSAARTATAAMGSTSLTALSQMPVTRSVSVTTERRWPHDVSIDGQELFYSHVRVQGGPAPVRRFLPDLIDRIWTRQIDPGQVFDLTLPLAQVAEGYAAMDSRRAIKTLLQP